MYIHIYIHIYILYALFISNDVHIQTPQAVMMFAFMPAVVLTSKLVSHFPDYPKP